jgi:hypothetical protein
VPRATPPVTVAVIARSPSSDPTNHDVPIVP